MSYDRSDFITMNYRNSKTRQRKEEKIMMKLLGMFSVLCLFVLTGCGNSTGWEFSEEGYRTTRSTQDALITILENQGFCMVIPGEIKQLDQQIVYINVNAVIKEGSLGYGMKHLSMELTGYDIHELNRDLTHTMIEELDFLTQGWIENETLIVSLGLHIADPTGTEARQVAHYNTNTGMEG